MSLSIVDYTKKMVKELEEMKKSAKFYQDNEGLLTTPLDDLLVSVGIFPETMPSQFVMELHGFAHSRILYAFDALDIRDTNGVYPELMDEESYHNFIELIDLGLREFGLSVDMKMDQEQREHFDKIVRDREETLNTYIPSYDIWYRIVCNMIFSPILGEARLILEEKYSSLLGRVTEYVMQKCENKRYSNDVIKQHISDCLALEGLRIFDLREVDWEEIELEINNRKKKSQRR